MRVQSSSNFGDRRIPHLPQCIDFKDGKVYPNERPQLRMVGEVTAAGPSRLYYRPDGSLTHW